MHELMLFEKNEQVVVGSRVVAERFGKYHKDILESIRNLMAENSAVKMFFDESEYTMRGKSYPEFLMSRDGFCLLVMGFTGKDALDWKLKYIAAFNTMEAAIRERLSTEWLLTRRQGKLVRRDETDAIALLIPYAEKQGSQSMCKQAYVIYTKLVNTLVGIEAGQRDRIPFKTLSTVVFLEDMIQHTVLEEMTTGTYYKEIYRKCKAYGEQIVRFAYLPKLPA